MRITEIKLMHRVNLGNYEHTEFAATAVLEENENLAEAADKLEMVVDWYARKQIRETQAHDMRKIISAAESEEKVRRATVWLEKYEARKASIEEL